MRGFLGFCCVQVCEWCGRLPSLRDLYGSGGIEQGCDTVMLLDRPAAYDPSAPKDRVVLLVAKNKDGECGKVELEFEGRWQRFREVG